MALSSGQMLATVLVVAILLILPSITLGGSLCNIACKSSRDCNNGTQWNDCVVCLDINSTTKLGKCKPVCTAPCSKPNQCKKMGENATMNQCIYCSRFSYFCMPRTYACNGICNGSSQCQSMECPACTSSFGGRCVSQEEFDRLQREQHEQATSNQENKELNAGESADTTTRMPIPVLNP